MKKNKKSWMNQTAVIATLCTSFGMALGTYISTPSSELSNDNKAINQNAIANATLDTDTKIKLISPSEDMTHTRSITENHAVDGVVGAGSGLWNWTPSADHHKAVVEVSTAHGSGTGVLIKVDKSKKVKDGFEGLVLTAWHVVQDDAIDGKIKVSYHNKRRAKGCQVMEYDEAKDVALLWVWTPNNIKPAKLAQESIKHGDQLEYVGLGGGTKLPLSRHFKTHASAPSTIEKIFADTPLLPGDSGGPLFNAKNEVVGIISGGWFWWDSGLKTESGGYIRTTWPARASNLGPLQSMLTKIGEDKAEVAETASTPPLQQHKQPQIIDPVIQSLQPQ